MRFTSADWSRAAEGPSRIFRPDSSTYPRWASPRASYTFCSMNTMVSPRSRLSRVITWEI